MGPPIDTVNLDRQAMPAKEREGGSGSSIRELEMSAPNPSSPHISECKNYEV